MTLEEPKLPIKISKASVKKWLSKGARSSDRVLSVSPKGFPEIFSPQDVRLHSWSYVSPENPNLKGLPSNFYDMVILYNVLGQYDNKKRKQIINEALRVSKSGGLVSAVNMACNDSLEIYNLLKSLDIDVGGFKNSRLSNKDISSLTPSEAVFIKDKTSIPNRRRLVAYLKEIGYDVRLDQMWSAGTTFEVNRLYIGMRWKKQ